MCIEWGEGTCVIKVGGNSTKKGAYTFEKKSFSKESTLIRGTPCNGRLCTGNQPRSKLRRKFIKRRVIPKKSHKETQHRRNSSHSSPTLARRNKVFQRGYWKGGAGGSKYLRCQHHY